MRTRTAAAAFAASLLGCSDSAGALSQEITTEGEDVDSIGPGDAQGSAFAGEWLYTSSELLTCSCAASLCQQFELLGSFQLVETDGQLRWLQDPLSLQGGINADGSFEVGGMNEVLLDGDRVGTSADRITGMIVTDAGATELSAVYWTRLVYTAAGEHIDCTLSGSLTASALP